MKKILMTMMAMIVGASVQAADTWTVDQAHSSVSFKIRHLVSKTSGIFSSFEGTIVTNFDNLDASSVEFTIDAASIDTANADRDKHLRSADFFDVENHPKISFKSVSITKTGDSTFDVTGDFTMHGVTKRITLPVEFTGSAKDPWGNTKAGFSLATKLSRKDYGITWNKALDAGSVMLGDEVDVFIDLEVTKKSE